MNELNRYIQAIEKNSFNFDLSGLRNDMNARFYYGGHLADVKISQEEFNKFVDDNKEEFNKVADEFVKKIKYYNKIK